MEAVIAAKAGIMKPTVGMTAEAFSSRSNSTFYHSSNNQNFFRGSNSRSISTRSSSRGIFPRSSHRHSGISTINRRSIKSPGDRDLKSSRGAVDPCQSPPTEPLKYIFYITPASPLNLRVLHPTIQGQIPPTPSQPASASSEHNGPSTPPDAKQHLCKQTVT